jgi:Protein of unknown function (DUF3618)
MAASETGQRTPEQVRRDIESHREELAASVEELRAATNIGTKLRAKLPAVAAGALGAGFLLAGGIGATMRLLARRGREGHEKARVGRFSLVDRD